MKSQVPSLELRKTGPHTQEVEERGLEVHSHPWLHRGKPGIYETPSLRNERWRREGKQRGERMENGSREGKRGETVSPLSQRVTIAALSCVDTHPVQ